MIDWLGVAAMLGAVGGLATVLVTLVLQVITFRDQRQEKRNAMRREHTLNRVAQAVNAEPPDK